MYQYLWNAANRVFIRKFIPISVYITEESKINYLSFYLKEMEKKTLPQTRLWGSSVHEISMDKEEEIKTQRKQKGGNDEEQSRNQWNCK